MGPILGFTGGLTILHIIGIIYFYFGIINKNREYLLIPGIIFLAIAVVVDISLLYLLIIGQ